MKNDDIEIILVAEQLTRASIVIAAPPGVYASYAELLREYDLFRAHSPDDVDIILQLQSGELDMLIIHHSLSYADHLDLLLRFKQSSPGTRLLHIHHSPNDPPLLDAVVLPEDQVRKNNGLRTLVDAMLSG